jgi:hypothetical protein
MCLCSDCATGWKTEELGLDSRKGKDTLLFSITSRQDVHPASYTVGRGDGFPGGKMTGREAEHSPPPCAEVELHLHTLIRLHGLVIN